MPVIRPSTIRRARRSRAEMRASVLGSRYLRYSAAWGSSGIDYVLYGKQRSLRGPAFGPSSGGFWNGPFARDARHVPDVDELETLVGVTDDGGGAPTRRQKQEVPVLDLELPAVVHMDGERHERLSLDEITEHVGVHRSSSLSG